MSEAKQALYAALLQLQALTDLDDDAMQTATKQKIDSLMLQLQDLLEDEYSEHDAIQTAFNDLAIVLDDVVN